MTPARGAVSWRAGPLEEDCRTAHITEVLLVSLPGQMRCWSEQEVPWREMSSLLSCLADVKWPRAFSVPSTGWVWAGAGGCRQMGC